MQTTRTFRGKSLWSLFAALALVAGSSAANDGIKITKHRFQKRGKTDRLVMEFESGPASAPTVKVRTDGTTATVEVSGATLSGAVPEAEVNEPVSKKGRFLKEIAFDADRPDDGFSLRATLNATASKVDAFWLADPPRLVVDVHGRGSSSTAAEGESKLKLSRRAKDEFSCFPANTAVGLSVVFQPRAKGGPSPDVRIDLEAGSSPESLTDAVVCYPKSSQVEAVIAFHEGVEALSAAAPRPTAASIAAAPPTTAPPKTASNRALTGSTAKAPGGGNPMVKPSGPSHLLPPLK